MAAQDTSFYELVEEIALDNVVQQQFKELVWKKLRDNRERLVMHLSYEIGLLPSEIYTHFPQSFSSVDEVRRIKERVLKRLRYDSRLQAWLED